MTKTDVFNPAKTVTLGTSEIVEVKELSWRDYMKLMKDLAGHLQEILKFRQEDGNIALDSKALTDLITGQEQLLAWVLAKSTGKDSAWVDNLTGLDALKVLQIVIELNLSEELVSRGKALAASLAAALNLKTPLPGSSIT